VTKFRKPGSNLYFTAGLILFVGLVIYWLFH
jgi:hypothetical protein